MLVPLVAAAACAAPPPRAQPRADRPRYELVVRVHRGFRRVTGNVRVRFTANRPTDRLVFRLWPNGPLQLQEGERLDVGAVTEGGRRLDAGRPDPTTLVVHLGRQLDAGGSVTVAVPWTLRVPSRSRDRISGFRGGLRLGSFFPILAWDPARGWVTNPPAQILSESSTTPTADFIVRVQTPSGSRAVVSGEPAERGLWRAGAMRDVAVAVGPFRVRTATAHVPSPVKIRLAYTAGTLASPGRTLQTVKEALVRLSRLYGSYPWRTYTVVVPPGLGEAGIEYPTLSYVGARRTTLVARHETGHQWFYSLVGNDQYEDPWLDEGGASWAQGRLGSPVGPPGRPVTHVGESMAHWGAQADLYFLEVYLGSVAALRSLGSPAQVDCALRLYVARNAYRIARPGDLLDALNTVIPGAEEKLRRFGIHR